MDEPSKGKTETLILSKKDEQERVQKKTFTNWLNTYLVKSDPPYKVDNIYESIKNGLCLIHLLEVISGERLKKEQPRNIQRIHCLSNINSALDFLRKKQIKLVNINATDLADGKPPIVLGLLWSIILFFQIEEQEEILAEALGPNYDGKVNAKAALLSWVNKTIGGKYDMNLTDFGPGWRDGKAFSALVHNIDPSLIDWEDVQKRSNKENLIEAFNKAEELGIPHILDVQDVDVDRPDEKSIMTYITQFLKAYPDGGKPVDDEIVAVNKAKEEAAIREREEEEERRRIEEELENERRRKEEERLKQEEAERKRKEEEERRLREAEERKRKEEEERKRQEAERKRKEEEERRRREEEERRRQEAERKRKEEEERKRKEEEERKRREEEERRRQEAERKRKEEEERKRKEEEERKKKLEEANNRDKVKEQLQNMGKWIDDLHQFLQDPVECDNYSLSSFLENLSGLLSDKDLIENDLSGLKDDITSGICGTEYVKPLMSEIQDFEKKFKDSIKKANNVKSSVEQNLDNLKNCEKAMDEIANWIQNSKDCANDICHANSDKECEKLLNAFRNHLATEPKATASLKGANDLLSKIKATAPPNVTDSMLRSKIEDLGNNLKKEVEKGKTIDKSLKDYNKSYEKANDWINDFEKKLCGIGSPINDINKLKQQLDKIEKLKKTKEDGDRLLQDVIEKSQSALENTKELHPIQVKINDELESCENRWLSNLENLDKLKEETMKQLGKCEGVVETGNKIDNWLRDQDNCLKSCKNPCDSLAQKQSQLEGLQKLLQEIEDQSPDIASYIDKMNEMSANNPAMARRISATKQQYDNLVKNVKDAIQNAESGVRNHDDFSTKMKEALEWVEMAKALKLSASDKDGPANLDEIQKRKNIIDQLLGSKKIGEGLVKTAVASGESVAKETSVKGREDILKQLRGLNKDFNDIFDGLNAMKQALEGKLAKASNLNRDIDALEKWSEDFDKRLGEIGDCDVEKIKALCEEAQNKLYLAGNVCDQAKSIDDPDLLNNAMHIRDIVKNCYENAQHMGSNIMGNVKSYNDFVKNCSVMDNWLDEGEKKIGRFSEENATHPEDFQQKLRALEKLAEDIREKKDFIEKVNNQGNELYHGVPTKSNDIETALDKLNSKYQKLMKDVDKKQQSLKDNIRDQDEFDDAMRKAVGWLNNATQKLLKYSDIKQCSPNQLETFSKNFSDIVDNMPIGDDLVSAAILTGQNHLTHLKQNGKLTTGNSERDSKKIHELDKNWHDFKRQLDLVNKNLNRAKDSLYDFNLTQKKLENLLDDKENIFKQPHSEETLRYLLRELKEAEKDISDFQNKGQEISNQLNYPDASKVSRNLLGRYQKLRQDIDAEMDNLQKLENEWATYKEELNASEKWIVNTGFRLIDKDYNAYSPEEAQMKLDESNKIHEDIINFSKSIDRVMKMGRELSEKLSKSQKSSSNKSTFQIHSSKEIESDLQHLKDGYKSLLDNSQQTRNRLEGQVLNWRKFRDLVQANDKYLNNDMVNWWRDKKYVMPQSIDDVAKNIEEAERVLQDLINRQSEIKACKSNCQSPIPGSEPRRKLSDNPEKDGKSSNSLMRLAQNVESGFMNNIDELNKYIPKLQGMLKEWKSFDKDVDKLTSWLAEKERIFENNIRLPSMKSSSLTEYQRAEAERLMRELDDHQKNISDLLDKGQNLGTKKVAPLIQKSNDLRRNLKKLLERKDEETYIADFPPIKPQTVECQNSAVQFYGSETIATQTTPEKTSTSTSTDPPIMKMNKSIEANSKRSRSTGMETSLIPIDESSSNRLGLRNSGGNRGISKMLYPYCCTSDLLNQAPYLDYVNGSKLLNKQNYQQPYFPPKKHSHIRSSKLMTSSKTRNGIDESVRKNWMAQNFI